MYRGLRRDPEIEYGADIAMLQTLTLMLEATLIKSDEFKISLQKSRQTADVQVSNHSTNISASRLLEQFKNESNRYTGDRQNILASFGERSLKNRDSLKQQLSQFEEIQPQKTNQQQQYFKQSRTYSKKTTNKMVAHPSHSTFKQEHDIKQSVVTFSPLRIDISLPSLTSEDLDQLKEQKLFINEIQSDIKQLIKKIKSNQSPQESPRKEEYSKKLSKINRRIVK